MFDRLVLVFVVEVIGNALRKSFFSFVSSMECETQSAPGVHRFIFSLMV